MTPPTEPYACQRCGRRDGLDAVVEDWAWAQITPSDHPNGGLLCLWCMDDLLFTKGFRNFPVRLYFVGRALYSVPEAE